ncbi:4-hydroxy-tetrahydrodipicolinate reductase [Frankliniella fusca]|uniref:4-hydroxy-tetrahydrodipicolinate reductase n=1 Tax=Frankliniella fusca TaxID=407009 RepID=A0AAE1GQT3_9NEOP|nr:4-hydroxy-tetrahydrodipicolinate reductase [Frankliniella fusca]
MGLWNSKEIQLEVVRRPRSASIKPFATAEDHLLDYDVLTDCGLHYSNSETWILRTWIVKIKISPYKVNV